MARTKVRTPTLLKLHIQGEEPLLLSVLPDVAERLRDFLDLPEEESAAVPFFRIDTWEGKAYVFNTEALQGVQFLVGNSPAPMTQGRYKGPVTVALRGRERIVFKDVDRADVGDFFEELNVGAQNNPFPRTVDKHGSTLALRARDILYVIAPAPPREEANPPPQRHESA